jgi:ABC-type multidrug transport system ATPase subunit
VFSTHYMEEAERLSDRIAIIDSGRVIAFGTVRELVSRLKDSYRLSYHDPANGHMCVQRYETFADVQVQIQRMRLSEYSIARASLEDVYFELAGRQFQDDEEPAEVLQ